jgi:HD-GYP domain-containing protein (c-di-GMP phosphodiesterase class II)
VSFLANEDKLLDLARSMDEFEGYPAGQASRVAWVADALAEKLGVANRDREFLDQAALLHDLGEMRMGRDYIRDDRGLTPQERLDLERHPVIGEQEIAKLELPRSTQLIVRWHHEWWNGTGYPDRLEAEQIPLSARILRIADAYCSLTADRPWRKAISDDDARRHLNEWAGLEFDPSIVLGFRDIHLPDSAEKTNEQRSKEEAAEIFSSFR